ncbi:uncharacterized protein LOC143463176 [Clavelina lepadiformis]|uniref:Anaphase-promoting complex subunit 15 n=1 Tax=Clavelina lepadiformis TaxID=159417 RepID=A0ABP0H110_CLALP
MMSTSFPTFTPKTSDPLWFSAGEEDDYEVDLCILETKYKNRLKSIIQKDKEALYIGKKQDSMPSHETGVEGGSEESEEEEEEEDLNDYIDSPEEQNAELQADIEAEEEDTDNNSWMI